MQATTLRDQFNLQKELILNSSGVPVVKNILTGVETVIAGGSGAGVAVADPAALTSAALTDSSGGTANTTVQAIGGSFSQSEIANNFADVAAQCNALRVDLAATRTALINLITSLENAGIIAT